MSENNSNNENEDQEVTVPPYDNLGDRIEGALEKFGRENSQAMRDLAENQASLNSRLDNLTDAIYMMMSSRGSPRQPRSPAPEEKTEVLLTPERTKEDDVTPGFDTAFGDLPTDANRRARRAETFRVGRESVFIKEMNKLEDSVLAMRQSSVTTFVQPLSPTEEANATLKTLSLYGYFNS